MWTFELSEHGSYTAALDDAERGVLIEAIEDVVDLLGGQVDDDEQHGAGRGHPLDSVQLGAEPVPAPGDPALLRLLPDGYRDDTDGASEFRRLTEDDVRSTKVANLLQLRSVLRVPVPDLTAAQAPQVAAALTDLRLVVSERLGIRSDADGDAVLELVTSADPPSDGAQAVRRFLATLYTMLGMLQESLVGLMLEDLPDDGRR